MVKRDSGYEMGSLPHTRCVMAKPSNPFNHSPTSLLSGRLAATLFAALLALPPASLAEDTEIFFGGATSGDDVIRPNVLFIMDTSGSMSSTVYGTGKSRMENMKEALHAILDSTSNVNVGLMRFHSRDNSETDGGPILFPIANIDGDACDYETCAASGTAGSVLSQINASEDDAEQYTQNNEVSLDSRELELIHSPALATGEETIEGYVQQRRDDAEASPDTIYSTTDDDLDMGNYTVLFRFPTLRRGYRRVRSVGRAGGVGRSNLRAGSGDRLTRASRRGLRPGRA